MRQKYIYRTGMASLLENMQNSTLEKGINMNSDPFHQEGVVED